MQSRFARLLLILVLLLAAGLALARVVRGPTPTKFAVAQTDPIDLIERGGAWYWIERPAKAKARLVRNGEVLTTADLIVAFDTDGSRVVLATRDVGRSSVKLISGGTSKELWSGSETLGKPIIRGSQILWAVSTPGPLKTVSPLAALGPQSRVFVTDADGQPRPLVSLPESPVDILGTQGDKAYALSIRSGMPPATALYSIPLNGGLPQRIAGESGDYSGLLRSDGKLFWVADSRDAGSAGIANSVRSLGPDGKPVIVAEWLPTRGKLYESRGETIYVDPTFSACIWRIRTNEEYPDRIGLPTGYAPFAIGDSQILLRKMGDLSKTTQLFVIPRP